MTTLCNSLYDPKDEHDACGVGFAARIDGSAQRHVVETALSAMGRLAHRGALAADGKSGDGAGLLLPIPREFFLSQWKSLSRLNRRADSIWAVGQLFLPQDAAIRESIFTIIRHSLAAQGFTVADSRETPIRPEVLGARAQHTLPQMVQILVLPQDSDAAEYSTPNAEACELRLYIARRCMENAAQAVLGKAGLDQKLFHVASLSCRSIVYKGMLPGAHLADFYPDLQNPLFKAAFAVFHERFSTNTLPAWSLAQPFRNLAHNGEINTIKGNVLRMKGRESLLASPLYGASMGDVLPVVDENGSDSAMFDNVLELLVRGGRSLPHALMMMVPEPFGRAYVMGDNKRAFYEYHAALMEPWDGPTAMVFTDGWSRVGALLDRNGLRPLRYHVDKDGLMVLASETGVSDQPARDIRQRGQLQPRRMIMADMLRNRIVPDAEIKGQVIRRHPYRRWLNAHSLTLDALHLPEHFDLYAHAPKSDATRKAMFGYSERKIRDVLVPMLNNAQEPVAAMGNDQPLAVLAEGPQLLFDYFKQQFAQVTNPPIDSQREELSMSLMAFTGRERNLLEPGPEHCALLRLQHPFLTRGDMARLRASRSADVQCYTLDATFDASAENPEQALQTALAQLYADAEQALANGATLLVVSDAGAGPDRAPIPSLLASAGLHHHLLRRGLRHACGLIVETGEASEIMHMALLVAYGASAVCPYAALDIVSEYAEEHFRDRDPYYAIEAYITALRKGFLKTLARLGISTLRSFRGGQTFEAVGLATRLVEDCFTGTKSRLGGIGYTELAREAVMRHRCAFSPRPADQDAPEPARPEPGDIHLWSKEAVRGLHVAVRAEGEESLKGWEDYAKTSDEQPSPVTLRALFEFAPSTGALPLEAVEPATRIVKRFVGAAMSLGSLSAEAHETIAMAMNSLGARTNSGEGGEDPARNHPMPDTHGNIVDKRSRIRQIASGRFGMTAEYLAFADEIQIKMAQGAKPGEGGQLPAQKVTPEIARVRHTMPGVSLISPPPHHDIYSIEDLAQLIFDLRHIQPTAKISVKLVAEAGVGTVAVGCVKAGADAVIISGHDGGTGASPLSAIMHAGLPWEMGLAETRQALEANNLRDSVTVQTDGLLRTGRDIVIAALLGADEFALGTGLMVSMGCVMCRKCHRGKCPVGIATQDPELRRRFAGTPQHVIRYLMLLAEDVRRHLAMLGLKSVDEAVGRADLLRARKSGLSTKAATLDLSGLLAFTPRKTGQGQGTSKKGNAYAPSPLEHATPLEKGIMAAALPVLQGLVARCTWQATVTNTDRATGTRLSGDMARAKTPENARSFPDHSIRLQLAGAAGQSLGAFLASGITIDVRGESNDYVGKGLSGGIITIAPGKDNPAGVGLPVQSIIGNVALYGATSGQLYVGGMAGERFAVRNSGATAVVEGVGDHACEYMTGGTVVVIGPCGYNFAAGMSGGIAFVYDGDERFQNRCNTDTVDIESVWIQEDRDRLRHLLEQHVHYTGSQRASAMLANWDASLSLFVKVVPLGYEEALRRMLHSDRNDADTISNTEEVFAH